MIQQRYVLALTANLGILVVYCMRVNLSVAIIAMVNNTDSKNISSEDCPQIYNNTSDKSTSYTGDVFDWPRQLQGFILSAFYWGYIFLQIPGAVLAQRYGAKWIFAFGIVSTSVITIFTPLAARVHVYLFIALRFLEGVGEGVTYPAIVAMLGRWSPRDETSLIFSITMVGGNIGIIMGQIMSGPLCSSTFLGGWPSVFYISGGLGVLWVIPWSLLVYDSPDKHPRISIEEKEQIINSIGSSQEAPNKQSVPWRQILLSRYVWILGITIFISDWLNYTILTCLPQFLSDVLHFDITDNSIAASAPYMSNTIFAVLFSWGSETIISHGWMKKTAVRKLFSFIAMFGCASCLFLVTLTSCSTTMVIVLLVVGFSLFSANSGGYGVNALDLSPEYSGIVCGFPNILSTVSGILSPIVTDTVTKHKTIHEWNIIFYIATGAAAFGTILFLLFSTAERQEWHSFEDDERNLLVNEKNNFKEK